MASLPWFQILCCCSCVLAFSEVAEKGTTQGGLAKALEKFALAKMKGSNVGNVIVHFDANLFGEAITAPHIRKAPIQEVIVKKMWKAIIEVREDKDQAGLLPPGDVLVIINGGRKQDGLILNAFGMGKERRTADKGRKEKDGKTVAREIQIFFSEESVLARKFRKKSRNDFYPCSQKASVFYNGVTVIQQRQYRHFPGSSNLGDVIGPVALVPYQNMAKLTVKAKREFWGHRRRAVGGKTAADPDDEEDEDEDDDEEDEEEMIDTLEPPRAGGVELPGVGGGRGAKGLADDVVQPVAYHGLPVVVTETLVHGFWGMNTIDMTPGAGDLCLANVTNKIGYLGICQTEAQRDFIITRLKKEILKEMGKAGSLLYMPAYAKEHGAQEAKSEAEAKANTKKRPKLVAPAKVKEDEEKGEKGAEKATAAKAEAGKEDDGQGPSKKSKKHEVKAEGVNEKLQQMLALAKGKPQK